jgi:hypothetical protein
MEFAFHQILALHKRNPILRHIDTSKIGLLGHSGGASAVIAMSHNYQKQIQAAVALDAPNQTDPSLNPYLRKAKVTFPNMFNIFNGFAIPMLQIHSTNAETFLSAPDNAIKLLTNNYLVTILSNSDDKNYFKHMDYSDYTLFKDISSLANINNYYIKHNLANPLLPNDALGSISGTVAMNTVNAYLVSFYNMYLLNEKDLSLAKCQKITENSTIKCGEFINIAVLNK